MRIGEYFVKHKYVSNAMLSKALEIQTQSEGKLIGDILVDLGAILKEDLKKHIDEFVDTCIGEARKGVVKIGEYFVKNNFITRETLVKALEIQKQNKGKLIGDVLVEMGAVSKEDLKKYVNAFINTSIGEAKRWLKQGNVDMIVSKYVSIDEED